MENLCQYTTLATLTNISDEVKPLPLQYVSWRTKIMIKDELKPLYADAHPKEKPRNRNAFSLPHTCLANKDLDHTMVENGKKHRQNSHLIIHFPTSEGVSEVSERANE